MFQLLKDVIMKNLDVVDVELPLSALDDSSVVDGIAFTTDSYTVKPLFFPGGDIGSLAVCGTVNDLAAVGAMPLALSAGFVIEDGFPMNDFVRILQSMRESCRRASTHIVTGDTKVVEKGGVDGMIINTSGIGVQSENLVKNQDMLKRFGRNVKWLSDSNVRDGDKIIVSGFIGDHGIALLSHREGLSFDTSIESDVAPLNHMMDEGLSVGGIVAAKDLTRGGLANALNEISQKSNVGILIYEDKIPVRESVRAACEFLGLDVLEIGNEGKMVIAVVPQMADDVLSALRETPEGRDAEIVGEARKDLDGVVMETLVGGRRIVEQPVGDPIPRIC